MIFVTIWSTIFKLTLLRFTNVWFQLICHLMTNHLTANNLCFANMPVTKSVYVTHLLQITWFGNYWRICFINAVILLQAAPPGKPLNGNRKAVAMKSNENRAVKKPDSSKAKSTSSVEPIQLPPSFKGAFKFGKVWPASYIPLWSKHDLMILLYNKTSEDSTFNDSSRLFRFRLWWSLLRFCLQHYFCEWFRCADIIHLWLPVVNFI